MTTTDDTVTFKSNPVLPFQLLGLCIENKDTFKICHVAGCESYSRHWLMKEPKKYIPVCHHHKLQTLLPQSYPSITCTH